MKQLSLSMTRFTFECGGAVLAALVAQVVMNAIEHSAATVATTLQPLVKKVCRQLHSVLYLAAVVAHCLCVPAGSKSRS